MHVVQGINDSDDAVETQCAAQDWVEKQGFDDVGGVGLATGFNQDCVHAQLVGALAVEQAVQGMHEVSAHCGGKSATTVGDDDVMIKPT